MKKMRLGWIARTLELAGVFGASEKALFVEHFDVSAATASRDQRDLEALLSSMGVIVDSRGGKLKLTEPAGFEIPEGLQVPTIEGWLKVNLARNYVRVPRPEARVPEPHILRSIVKAIRKKSQMRVLYISRKAPEGHWRIVSPHSLVEVSERLHARCYDHDKGRYGDFVLRRMLQIDEGHDIPAPKGLERMDEEWSTKTALTVSPAEGVDPIVAQFDYGIEAGSRRMIKVRKAIAPYLTDYRVEGFSNTVLVEEEKHC